jgi:hypothetical protein
MPSRVQARSRDRSGDRREEDADLLDLDTGQELEGADPGPGKGSDQPTPVLPVGQEVCFAESNRIPRYVELDS